MLNGQGAVTVGGVADVNSLTALRRARDRIDRCYADPLGIPGLAATAGYSREHFIRAFRDTYGETPGRYRTRRRVERACELLRSANLTVTEICCLVGFASLETLSTRFAEITGMSPSRYRAAAARRGGPAPVPGCFVVMWRAGLPAGPSLPEKPQARMDQLAAGVQDAGCERLGDVIRRFGLG
jgi:AraC-like DNA-binding protein